MKREPATHSSTPSQSTHLSSTAEAVSEKPELGDTGLIISSHPQHSRKFASFQASLASRWPRLHRTLLYIRGPRPKQDLASEPSSLCLYPLSHHLRPRPYSSPWSYVYLPGPHTHRHTRACDTAPHTSVHCTLAIRSTCCGLYHRLRFLHPGTVVPHTLFLVCRLHVCFLDGECWLWSQRRAMCSFHKHIFRLPMSCAM